MGTFKPQVNPFPSYLKEDKDRDPLEVLAGNKATILRADALYRKKQIQEMKILKAYEAEKRDAFEFHTWQHEMRERDEMERQQEIERRKLEMKLSREEAIKARERALEENKLLVDLVKMEKEEIGIMKEIALKEEEEKKKAKVKEMQSVREAIKEVKEEIQKKNREVAIEIALESKELKEQQVK